MLELVVNTVKRISGLPMAEKEGLAKSRWGKEVNFLKVYCSWCGLMLLWHCCCGLIKQQHNVLR